jgi:outer membrane protein OmpA-like peptidoglycan-associated protein
LKKRLDDNKPDQVRAATTEIDALIETARNRARLAGAKQDQALAVGAAAADRAAAQDQAAVASAQAAQASAEADRARADADRARAELAALQLKQTDAGATLVLQDVVFQTGKAELKPGAEARLRPIANYLAANPAVKVRIDGHTDAQGDDAYNMRLSQARAGSVRAALGTMGVDGARVEAVGHGESQPVADNGTDAGRQQNRRVELTLLGQQANGMAATR